jgi:hypothetical protein
LREWRAKRRKKERGGQREEEENNHGASSKRKMRDEPGSLGGRAAARSESVSKSRKSTEEVYVMIGT